MTEREEKNRMLAAKLLGRYASNDHDGLIGMVTDDCEFVIGAGKSQGIVPYHGVHTGHAQIRGYLKKRNMNMSREENACIIKSPHPGASGPQTAGVRAPDAAQTADDQPVAHASAHAMPMHEKFIVQGNVVVAMGHLSDKFSDGRDMHETDFVIVFKIDEAHDKISSFHYFFDTAAALHAWRERK